MKNLKVKLYNAIILLYDESETEYNGLEDEYFIEKVCRSIGMTETEYKDLMLAMDLGFEYDFQEICPHCDHVNDVSLSETKEYKDGKRILVCQNCGSVIFACNLCDCDECGKCYIEEGYKF